MLPDERDASKRLGAGGCLHNAVLIKSAFNVFLTVESVGRQ